MASTKIPPMPLREPVLVASGLVSDAWADWFRKMQAYTTESVATANIADGAVSFIKLLSTDWTSSKATNGYQKLGSGLYAQWGNLSVPVATEDSAAVTFPTAFPTACLQAYCTPIMNASYASTETGLWGVAGISTTGFTIHNRTTASLLFTWLAIGH